MRQTRSLLGQVAAGDFTQRLVPASRDAVGEMAAALNGTVDRVGDAIRTIASEANEDIGNRIETVQADSRQAGAALGRVTDLINRTEDIQHSIAGAVEQQSGSTQEVGTSVTRAVDRTRDIADRVAMVAGSTHGASEAAEQAKAAAASLAATAGRLRSVVGGFQVAEQS